MAKFYLNESGRDAVRDIARKAGIVVTSAVAVAEVSAAFHRKLRERAVDLDVFKALHGQFQYDLQNGLWRLIAPTEALLEQVRAVLVRLDRSVLLRSLDALRIASSYGEGGSFERAYSNDRRLLAASGALGFKGINPLNG